MKIVLMTDKLEQDGQVFFFHCDIFVALKLDGANVCDSVIACWVIYRDPLLLVVKRAGPLEWHIEKTGYNRFQVNVCPTHFDWVNISIIGW